MYHFRKKLSLFALFAMMAHLVTVDAGKKGGKKTITLTITNLSYLKPFGPFFVMVHNEDVSPLYTMGSPASDALADLAASGSPASLVRVYSGMPGVRSATAFMNGAPFIGGASFEIEVDVSKRYPLVTIASMAINTNDAFVALNGVELESGMVYDMPGLDAGSEENNGLCNSILRPACGSPPNVRSLNGEGCVHVHPGVHGIGDLSDGPYDWRNPMMRVTCA